MNVLVVSLVVGGKVSVATRHTLTCAEKIAPEVDVLLIGEVPEDAATQVASFSGVRSVFVCQMASVGAEGGACQVKAQSEGYSHIRNSRQSRHAARGSPSRRAGLIGNL